MGVDWVEAAIAATVPVIKFVTTTQAHSGVWRPASCLLWLAKEGGDEDTGVKVECGMPPAVREIQHLAEGSTGFSWGTFGLIWLPSYQLLTSPA